MKFLFDIDGKHHEIELSEGETKRLEYAEGRFADVTAMLVAREPTPTRTGYGFLRVVFDNGYVWRAKEATIAREEKMIMKQTRIFFVNTRQTFAGSTLWTEDLLKKELGDSKWEVFWTNYSDEHPELADVNRLEGELTTDEIFSLIDRCNSHVGVLRLHQKADTEQMFSFDTDYWISPTFLYGTKVV